MRNRMKEFSVVLILGLLINLVGLVSSGILINQKVIVADINVGVILLTIQFLYFISSFHTLKADECGALLLFNNPVEDVGPGLYYVPPGIVSIWSEKRTVFQDELPGEPEEIFREDDKKLIPPGMVAPIRIKFGTPKVDDSPELKASPYNIEMTAETPLVVSWRIESPCLFVGAMGSVGNARKQMQDKAIELFNNEFSGITPAKASLTLAITSAKLKQQLTDTTSQWGIEIFDAFIKPFVFSHELNSDAIGVERARLTARAVEITAEGQKKKLALEGDGVAHAKRVYLEAMAVGTKKLAEATSTPEAQVALLIQTMGTALEKAQYSIIPGNDLFMATGGLAEMLEKIKGGGKK
jgi:regulator of protease activity HflC (stomatin/prohibitin superfamily)